MPNSEIDPSRCLAIIMGGGAGSRLYPLTSVRSKPAVPLGGKYRLVDIPISNCINAGLKQVYVLTQFNSASLNRHINQAYKFDAYSAAFVDILAAEQRPGDAHWYQGTADAVRRNFTHLIRKRYDYYLILSGDQLYRMNLMQLLKQHVANKSEITIATLPVDREDAKGFGIMQSDESGSITEFVEKPTDKEVLDGLIMPDRLREQFQVEGDGERFQASMGIYLFNRHALVDALDNKLDDFGSDIIPRAIKKHEGKVKSFIFQGYWEDIGTITSFYEANLELCATVPKYDFFDTKAPIYTHARFLPASKVNNATIDRAIISDGCILTRPWITNSIIGLRSVVEHGAKVEDSILMGSDHFEDELTTHAERRQGSFVPLGVGPDAEIKRAIIDKNARIGRGVVIHAPDDRQNEETPYYIITEGIVVIPKGLTIPDWVQIPFRKGDAYNDEGMVKAANPGWKLPKKKA